jgi:hypothetical protein
LLRADEASRPAAIKDLALFTALAATAIAEMGSIMFQQTLLGKQRGS